MGKLPKQIFGLPFLNPEEIGDCFAIDFMSIIRSETMKNKNLPTIFMTIMFVKMQ